MDFFGWVLAVTFLFSIWFPKELGSWIGTFAGHIVLASKAVTNPNKSE